MPDATYATMLLDNVADEVILECQGDFVDALVYDVESFDIVSGAALSLDPGSASADGNDHAAAWCEAWIQYGSGDRGTPGSSNPPCPPPDTEVDHCVVAAVDATASTAFVGAKVPLQVLVLEAGITDDSTGVDLDSAMTVQVGGGPAGTLPDGAGWVWAPTLAAPGWSHEGGFDAYDGSVAVDSAGPVDLAGRVTLDGGGTWTHCDRAPGSLDGFASAQAVHLSVEPHPCQALDCAAAPPATCAPDGVTVETSQGGSGTCKIEAGVASCYWASLLTDCGALPDGTGCGAAATCGVPAEAPTAYGQLVVSELMLAPDAVVPELGQWLEITNPGGQPLDLAGCAVDAGPGGSATLEGHLVIGAAATRVLGRASSLPVNGGVDVDWAYGAQIQLNPAGGAVALTCGGSVIDEVTWQAPLWPLTTGATLSLSPWSVEASANDDPSAWCVGAEAFGAGDEGTPGEPNTPCPGDVVPIEACALLTPAAVTAPAGTAWPVSVEVVGTVEEVEVGYASADAPGEVVWTWTPAIPAQGLVWEGDLAVPPAGAWIVAARATADAGHTWTLCDRGGSEDGFGVADATALESAPSACWPNPCGEAPGLGCAGDLVVDRVAPSSCKVIGADAAACAWVEELVTDCGALAGTCADGSCVDLPEPPDVGEVVLNELMISPASGAHDEWVELYNPTAHPLSVHGCQLESGPDEVALLVAGTPADVAIAGGGTLIAARSATAPGSAAVIYGETLSLDDAADSLRLVCGATVVDEVVWDAASGWAVPAGASLSLAGNQPSGGADPAAWCPGTPTSPGLPNPACPPLDATIDGCWLEAPVAAAAVAGEPVSVVALVLDAGATDVTAAADAPPGLLGQVGIGPADTPPGAWAWTPAAPDPAWLDADFDGPGGGVDRWIGAATPAAPGVWSVAARFSADGGATWTLCDLGGSADGFAVPDAGELQVSPGGCTPNPCSSPPTAVCLDTLAFLHPALGDCTALPDGAHTCSYPQATLDCAGYGGCESGACVAPPPLPAAPGDVVITEVMRDSAAPAPDAAEWVELFNPGEHALALEGCVLSDLDPDGDAEVVGGGLPVWIEAGDYVVIGSPTAFAPSADLPLAWSWVDTSLDNVFDELVLTCDGASIASVAWSVGWPGAEGVSMQLDPATEHPVDAQAAWCSSPVSGGGYGDAGDLGSPGAANPPCGSE